MVFEIGFFELKRWLVAGLMLLMALAGIFYLAQCCGSK